MSDEPNTHTTNESFETIKHLLSDKPPRRPSGLRSIGPSYILADRVTRRPKERGGEAGFIVTSQVDGSSEWMKAATFDKLAIPRQTPWDYMWSRAVNAAGAIAIVAWGTKLLLWMFGGEW